MEKAALVALYNATGGANWKNSENWLSDEPLNRWHGVRMVGGRVTELHLNGNGLRGEIPAEIGRLTHLKEMRFGEGNDLSGALPAELSRLTRLEVLDIGWSDVKGAIPEWLGSLTRLRVLFLDGNQFHGELPEELGNLTHLEVLTLHGNVELSGTLPQGLEQASSLYLLTFDQSRLCAPTNQRFQARILQIPNRRGSDCPAESMAGTTGVGEIIVRDIFGRVVNETGIVLVDWEGHIANPAMKYYVELPVGSATLSGSDSRLYFDLPSSVGANGPSKSLVSERPSKEVEFRVSIFPDRDTSDEDHVLTIRYMDNRRTVRTQTIDVHVIDQDIDRTAEFNIIADFRHDSTGMFDDPAAREIVQQGLDDFAYFIADMNLDEVLAGEERMWIWRGHEYRNGIHVTNAIGYTGFLVYVYGHPTDKFTASGGPSCDGRNQSSNGKLLLIPRSGTLNFDPSGNWNTLGWRFSLPESDWWSGQHSNIPYDLYSGVIHEMGHTLVYMGSNCHDGFAEFYETGEVRDPTVKDYFGSYPRLDKYGHFVQGSIDPASARGAYGNEHGAEMAIGRWLVTKLDLLVAQASGYTLRDTSPLRELSLPEGELAEGNVGDEYAHAMNVVGGIPAYFWTIESGELPDGLSLNSFTGTISGTPTEAGTFEFTVRVRDQTEGHLGVTRAMTLIVGD